MSKELDKILNRQKAGNDLAFFMIELVRKYNLTYAELYSILGLEIASFAKSQMKAEQE